MKTVEQKFATHARLRFDQAEAICAKADQFKVCSCCLSISFQRAPLCPLCHGYLWYESADAVKLVARLTQRSAVPFTAGVAPRLTAAQQDKGTNPPEPVTEDN
jgi:hypothetical protein